MIKKAIFFVVLLFPCKILTLTVGSNVLPSRQPLVTFPTAVANTMLGFAAFERGFTLADRSTTCTFDDFFPVGGRITLNDGGLSLLKDLVISNSCDLVTNGRIYGNAYSIELGKQLNDFSFPSTVLPGFTLVSTTSGHLSAASVLAADSSKDDKYIAVGTAASAASAEVRIYYFDGSTLTSTKTIELGVAANSVAWNSRSNYLAVARSSAAGNELNIYLFNTSNGSLTNSSGAAIGGDAKAVAWHQTGNFLALGSTDNGGELVLYPFNQTTGVLGTGSALNIAPNRDVSNNALSWSPGGNFLASGFTNNATSGAAELIVTSFNGTSLTISTSAELGNTVQSVDWSPTGTYIAVGTTGLASNLRVYNHQSGAGTLREVQSARTAETNPVQSVAWDRSGTFLLVGVSNGASSASRIYYFDPVLLNLTLITTFYASAAVNINEWSNSNRYLFFGTAGSDLVVTTTIPNRFLFSDTSLVLNTNVNVNASLYFQGNCKINGRGKLLNLQPFGQLTVRPGANLIFEDVEIEGLGDSKIRCLTDAGSITFRNSIIELTSNYTFSRGSILFDEDVMITGTSKFNYTSAYGSTIAADSTLYFGLGTTFSYSPRTPARNLLSMTDNTSTLYLDGSTLHSTSTGLQLTNGTLIIDDTVTFSSEARYAASAMTLNSNLSVNVLSGGLVKFFGLIRYD